MTASFANDTERATRRHYARVLSLAYLAWIVTFEAVGRYAATLPTIDLTTSWDRAIPLVPSFIWAYEACYIVPLLSLFVIRDWHRFNVAMLAILVANVTAFVAYLVMPVAFPRPELGTSLAERVLALEYATDFWPGANNFPSMHVAMSFIMGIAMYKQSSRLVDASMAFLVTLISVATLFVKQHTLLDVVAGAVWGPIAYEMSSRFYRRKVDPHLGPEMALSQLVDPRRWQP